MNSSTLILITALKLRLLIGAFIVFTISLFIGWIDPVDTGLLTGVVIISFFTAAFLKQHKILDNSMFPVTDRQIAYIPIATLFGFIGLGAMAVWLGQSASLHAVSSKEIAAYWQHVVVYFPAIAFLLLFFWRLLRIHFSTFSLYPILILNVRKAALFTNETLRETIFVHWAPLWIAGCFLLLFEAPCLNSAIRRRANSASEPFEFNARKEQQINEPVNTHILTSVLNALSGLVVAGAIISLAFIEIDDLTVLYGLLVLLVGWGVLAAAKEARASGMSQGKTAATVLMELTIVGYAFRRHLGVLPGTPVKCPYCKSWKMAWQSTCPNCNHSTCIQYTLQAPQSVKSPQKPCPENTETLSESDPAAFAFRRTIPLIAVVAIFIGHLVSR